MLLLAVVFWFNLHLKNQAWLQQTWTMGWHVQDFVMVFLIQHSSCKSIKLDKSRNHIKKDTSRWIYLGMNWMTWSPLFVTVESCMYNPKCSNGDKDIWFLVLTLSVAALDDLIITGKTMPTERDMFLCQFCFQKWDILQTWIFFHRGAMLVRVAWEMNCPWGSMEYLSLRFLV